MGRITTSDDLLKGQTELYFAVIRDWYGDRWSSSEPSSTIITDNFEYSLGYIKAFLSIFEDKLIGDVIYTSVVKDLLSIVLQSIASLTFDENGDLIPFKYHYKHVDANGVDTCVMVLDTGNNTFDLNLNIGGSEVTVSIYSRDTERITFLGI